MNLNKEQKAYIGGFLDGDGSIYVRLKPNSDYKFKFQISPSVVFYQSEKEKKFLFWLKRTINRGYIRDRSDGVIEYILGDTKSIEELLNEILPYLKLKKKQAKLMLKVLCLRKNIRNAKEFLKLSKEIDKFQELNYSKKRTQNSLAVKKTLIKNKLLAP